MAFYDAFFGSDQSLYTAYAIMAAIIAICITILLTATDVSVGNRILIVLFVIITLVPSIFLTLFEITCMVTGGTEPNRWWCYAFAWVLAAFIIIYCVFVVIISLISLFTYNNAVDAINESERKNKLSDTDTNQIAKQIIHTDEETKKLEKFYNVQNNPNEQFNSFLGLNPNNYKSPPPPPAKENFGSQPYEAPQPPPVPVPQSNQNFNNKQVSKFENQNNNFEIPEFKPANLPINHNDIFNNYNEASDNFNGLEGFEDYQDGKLRLKFANLSDFGLIDNMKKSATNVLNGFSSF